MKQKNSIFKKMEMRYDKKLETEFLPEALEIIEKPSSPVAHLAIWITIVLILIILLWSILGRVDETANARGKTITVEGLQTVQTVNGGIISEIYVYEGQKVKAGQKLMLLDATTEEKSMDLSIESNKLFKLKKKLLEDILQEKNIDHYNKEYKNTNEKNIIDYISSIYNDYENQKQQYDLEISKNQKQVISEEEKLEKIKKEIELLKKQKKELEKLYGDKSIEAQELELINNSIIILEQDEKDYKELYENDIISKKEWEDKKEELYQAKAKKDMQKIKIAKQKIEQKKELDEISFQINDTKAIDIQNIEIEKAKTALQQAQKNLKLLKEKHKLNISNMLVETDTNLMNVDADLEVKTQMYENKLLCAPVDGTVQTVAVQTVGGVVTPAQPLITILPDQAELIIEADLLNKDIGFVKFNQEVAIKLDTYNFQKYGALNGKITYISPDAIKDERYGLIYKVKIAVDTKGFYNDAKVEVAPGMEATVEIKTGSRRIIEFFLEPLMNRLDESLKVR